MSQLPKGITRILSSPTVDHSKNPGHPQAPAALLFKAQVATARQLLSHKHTLAQAAEWLYRTAPDEFASVAEASRAIEAAK
jgi:hypothetical protein